MKHIIFDLDGTLFDSAEGIYQSLHIAAQSIGLLAPTKSQVLSAIGPPIHKLIPLIYPNISLEELHIMCAAFRQHYDTIGYVNSSIYDGIEELLLALYSDDDIDKLSIVTNKPTLPTIKLLIKNRLHKYFDDIIGVDYPAFFNQGNNYSSKGQALAELLHPVITSDSAFVYIGDTASDLEAALFAGCKFVAVNYGFYSWQESSHPLVKIANSPFQLRTLIEKI